MNMDTALYPSLMIQYDYFSRNIGEAGKEKYREIYRNRLAAKKEGRKGEADALKLVLWKLGSSIKHPLNANQRCA